ncbi:hypothetical protein K432DRAFT_406527 [Lepidopterella palustris CBS 459.81]|uniref:Uncharacterized protein n=1 Tax=Lepidopterella palustris CBS 459.81 TaxID=1314670 RepID=A0A8E2E6P5_9PEZI|nr:hypothetical protein K432DRAFT_406527 [Lepidopterella palustris CBS 459.81]
MASRFIVQKVHLDKEIIGKLRQQRLLRDKANARLFDRELDEEARTADNQTESTVDPQANTTQQQGQNYSPV